MPSAESQAHYQLATKKEATFNGLFEGLVSSPMIIHSMRQSYRRIKRIEESFTTSEKLDYVRRRIICTHLAEGTVLGTALYYAINGTGAARATGLALLVVNATSGIYESMVKRHQH